MYFVTTDIHGCMEQFEAILKHWNPKKQTFVFLGDAVDRGRDSLQVVRTLMEIKAKHPDSIILQGNHDDMFVQWAMSDEFAGITYSTQFDETIRSFYGERDFRQDTRRQRAAHILWNREPELRFLQGLPLYHETEHCVFVHAGIDPHKEDWRKDGRDTFLWIREPFISYSGVLPKRVFFGHTPTQYMNDGEENNIWIGPNGDRVAMDGACVFSGQLNAALVADDGTILDTYKIDKAEREPVRIYE